MNISKRKVLLHLYICVAEDKQPDFLNFLRSAIPFYEGIPGINVRLLQNSNDPTSFIELIEYDNWDKYKEDSARVEADPTMQAHLDTWRSFLVRQSTSAVFTDLTEAIKNEEG